MAQASNIFNKIYRLCDRKREEYGQSQACTFSINAKINAIDRLQPHTMRIYTKCNGVWYELLYYAYAFSWPIHTHTTKNAAAKYQFSK